MSGRELARRCLCGGVNRLSLLQNGLSLASDRASFIANKGPSHLSNRHLASYAHRRALERCPLASGALLRHASTEEKEQTRGKTTHFGFQDVTEEEKEEKVRSVFEGVAGKYDVMNDLMSLGVHRLWKDRFVEALGPVPGARMLDVAGGTGDIAFRCIKRLLEGHTADSPHPSHQMTILDLSANMLSEGRKRAEALGYHGVEWVCGNAQSLPFPDNSFDSYTIAFGIRNVVDIPVALAEAYRVLRPGGRFLCLEFSHLRNAQLQKVYDAYSFNFLPPLGHVVAGDWGSYQYLVESIRKFPKQEEFSEMIETAGFRRVRHEDLSFGVTAIHTGCKL